MKNVTKYQRQYYICLLYTSLGEYEILELARTGITGLSRGASDVKFL